MEFLVWLQETGLATWVRESVSLWAYPTQIALHAMGLGMLVGLSSMVCLRILGVAAQIPLAALDKVFGVMWIAFAVNLFSGLLLTIAYAEKLLANPVFLVKLAGLVVSIALLAWLKPALFGDPGALAADKPPPRARQIAVALLVAWTVTLVAGRLTAYEILLFSM